MPLALAAKHIVRSECETPFCDLFEKDEDGKLQRDKCNVAFDKEIFCKHDICPEQPWIRGPREGNCINSLCTYGGDTLPGADNTIPCTGGSIFEVEKNTVETTKQAASDKDTITEFKSYLNTRNPTFYQEWLYEWTNKTDATTSADDALAVCERPTRVSICKKDTNTTTNTDKATCEREGGEHSFVTDNTLTANDNRDRCDQEKQTATLTNMNKENELRHLFALDNMYSRINYEGITSDAARSFVAHQKNE